MPRLWLRPSLRQGAGLWVWGGLGGCDAEIMGDAFIGGDAVIMGGRWDGSEGRITTGEWLGPDIPARPE